MPFLFRWNFRVWLLSLQTYKTLKRLSRTLASYSSLRTCYIERTWIYHRYVSMSWHFSRNGRSSGTAYINVCLNRILSTTVSGFDKWRANDFREFNEIKWNRHIHYCMETLVDRSKNTYWRSTHNRFTLFIGTISKPVIRLGMTFV